ncbi:rhodanese-like domain-containing protein [Streptococcus iniae]|uniref:Rhodanese n=1 Tax=Streptococcus iniae TaxID=1346 RepID=A0A3L8GCR8_STRIN|nr:rhodanese-like domain-containing protein [Streptococcus iniae]AGM99524.1 hypothetical protein K710_1774 [Streptococcus iniae SF1]AHY16448.1 rhodanese [Streptococcus iniae]AHY18311.1 rhodanese [Streptococcus iniae]AJG26594.1 rhodanese [Streptococcus iniae]APD32469.1 rhodanese [Streptococcus iniae]
MTSETIAALQNALSKGGCNLIDVREDFEYQLGHVPGSQNIPLSRLGQDYNNLDKDQTYHIICQSGGRSAQAVAFLEQEGYQAINVEGGTSAWTGLLESSEN